MNIASPGAPRLAPPAPSSRGTATPPGRAAPPGGPLPVRPEGRAGLDPWVPVVPGDGPDDAVHGAAHVAGELDVGHEPVVVARPGARAVDELDVPLAEG